MKLLIATRADDNIADMTAITHPVMRDYATKCKADFGVIDHEQVACESGDGKWHYRIMLTYDLYDEYDRILWMDSDIVINKDCPNIFDVVPEHKIGTIYEDKGSRKMHRRELIHQVQNEWGNVGWSRGYINTGVFVTSKMHRTVFTTHEGKFWTGFGYDDVMFGYNIHKRGFTIHELPYQFNHMSMFSEEWNGSPDPLRSHIIHFAGKDRRDNKEIEKTRDIIYGDEYK